MGVKMGGKPRLRVFLKGGADLASSLLPVEYGPSACLPELVRQTHDGYDAEVLHEPCGPCHALLVELEAAVKNRGAEDAGGAPTGLVAASPDVVVFSIAADIGTGADVFQAAMRKVIRIVKDELGSHVIIYNGSSVVPSERVSNYHRVSVSPSLQVHRLNLAVLELSVLEGISVIDVDRIIAELGANDHVFGLLEYSAEACRALSREFLRVLDDYGFFEPRPLLVQMGAPER
jgi:hypothetical protein